MAHDQNDIRRGRFYDEDRDRGRRDERGFFERAGDEVASWFGDEEAQRRREADERRWAREHAARGGNWDGGSDRGWATGGGVFGR